MNRVGSLFSGYGGLDLAVGGELAWYSEIDSAACKVLETHHPSVPNLGDITKIDWSDVPKIDILTAGYPCQPFSTAGKRKGRDDERHLWPFVRDAISAMGPRLTILENVRGHLTLGFADVLADLADLGMSARWGVVRAADAGACHGRARLFIISYPGGRQFTGPSEWWGFPKSPECRINTSDAYGASIQTYDNGRPWPGNAGRFESLERDWEVTADSGSERYGFGKNDRMVGGMDGENRGSREKFRTGSVTNWGQYSRAIERWESILGRPAPTPTVRRNNRDRLNPVFVEWMMGLPEGWVTGHGLSASQELKMLGNGVVPQQARLALNLLAAA